MDKEWAKEILKTLKDGETVNVIETQPESSPSRGGWLSVTVMTTYTKEELIKIANG